MNKTYTLKEEMIKRGIWSKEYTNINFDLREYHGYTLKKHLLFSIPVIDNILNRVLFISGIDYSIRFASNEHTVIRMFSMKDVNKVIRALNLAVGENVFVYSDKVREFFT